MIFLLSGLCLCQMDEMVWDEEISWNCYDVVFTEVTCQQPLLCNSTSTIYINIEALSRYYISYYIDIMQSMLHNMHDINKHSDSSNS
jgi:hypothetical protein